MPLAATGYNFQVSGVDFVGQLATKQIWNLIMLGLTFVYRFAWAVWKMQSKMSTGKKIS